MSGEPFFVMDAELDRRSMLGGSAAALAAGMINHGDAMAQGSNPAHARRFDFLIGRWKVRHRKLKARLQGSNDWFEFPGTLDVKPILSGLGNVDENELFDPAGTYLATSLRVFRPKSGDWSVYWIDGRSAGIDKPCVGRFDGKTGHFYADDEFAGKPIKVRFTYSDLGPRAARWEQAFSPDAGRSWETNWTMDFSRVGERPA
jgi:hypothetical protein